MKKIVIYGAGKIGKRYLDFLQKLQKKDWVIAFCDKNYMNILDVDGIDVISFEEAVKLKVPFLVAMARDKESVVMKLEELGLPYYYDMDDFISNHFHGEEKAYYKFIYKNQGTEGENIDIFGKLSPMLARQLLVHTTGYKKVMGGYCTCCEQKTIFASKEYWLRDHYRCILCNSIPRQRAMMNVLNNMRPNWRELTIHESSPSGPTMELMKQECPEYSYSYFIEQYMLGEKLGNGGTNQNIEKMTFDDDSFDIYITQDVFEHVNNPFAGFKEIERVLRPGGIHLFTVPLYPFMKSRPRISFNNGRVENILPALFHGNPISKEGALVTYDWGSDIVEKIEESSGMKTVICNFEQTAECVEKGLEADFLQVLVSFKKK